MGYDTTGIKKNGLAQISCVTQLLSIRTQIENKEQHKGKSYEIALQAYKDIKKHYGLPAPNSSCKSGCIIQMNKLLNNWFIQYDKDPKAIRNNRTVKSNSDQLIPIQTRREKLLATDWAILKEQALEQLGTAKYEAINGSRPPKKIQLVEELLKL